MAAYKLQSLHKAASRGWGDQQSRVLREGYKRRTKYFIMGEGRGETYHGRVVMTNITGFSHQSLKKG